jgi:hypothetical protein
MDMAVAISSARRESMMDDRLMLAGSMGAYLFMRMAYGMRRDASSSRSLSLRIRTYKSALCNSACNHHIHISVSVSSQSSRVRCRCFMYKYYNILPSSFDPRCFLFFIVLFLSVCIYALFIFAELATHTASAVTGVTEKLWRVSPLHAACAEKILKSATETARALARRPPTAATHPVRRTSATAIYLASRYI